MREQWQHASCSARQSVDGARHTVRAAVQQAVQGVQGVQGMQRVRRFQGVPSLRSPVPLRRELALWHSVHLPAMSEALSNQLKQAYTIHLPAVTGGSKLALREVQWALSLAASAAPRAVSQTLKPLVTAAVRVSRREIVSAGQAARSSLVTAVTASRGAFQEASAQQQAEISRAVGAVMSAVATLRGIMAARQWSGRVRQLGAVVHAWWEDEIPDVTSMNPSSTYSYDDAPVALAGAGGGAQVLLSQDWSDGRGDVAGGVVGGGKQGRVNASVEGRGGGGGGRGGGGGGRGRGGSSNMLGAILEKAAHTFLRSKVTHERPYSQRTSKALERLQARQVRLKRPSTACHVVNRHSSCDTHSS